MPSTPPPGQRRPTRPRSRSRWSSCSDVKLREGYLPFDATVTMGVGAMALAWDAGTDAVVIEAQTPTEDGDYVELPDDAEDGPDLLRVRINAADARGFVRRAEALLTAGRPACPFCGQPLDPLGHFCPRGNGALN